MFHIESASAYRIFTRLCKLPPTFINVKVNKGGYTRENTVIIMWKTSFPFQLQMLSPLTPVFLNMHLYQHHNECVNKYAKHTCKFLNNGPSHASSPSEQAVLSLNYIHNYKQQKST
jgi:hypothetical protein